MPTWNEMAVTNFGTAKSLHRNDPRSSASRAYYAAYAAVTACLAGRVTFARGWQNPEHAALREYVRSNLGLTPYQARQVNAALHRLFIARLDADYRPAAALGEAEARMAAKDAAVILRALGLLECSR